MPVPPFSSSDRTLTCSTERWLSERFINLDAALQRSMEMQHGAETAWNGYCKVNAAT
jgi:hypothetical protein